MLTDSARRDIDGHPMLLNEPVMKESLSVNRAVFEWTLEV